MAITFMLTNNEETMKKYPYEFELYIKYEIVENKVINQLGKDVTKEYLKGASIALEKALSNNVKFAVLKAKSPSCGCGLIYDGTFNHNLIHGDGVTTKLLKEHNIQVYTEEDI